MSLHTNCYAPRTTLSGRIQILHKMVLLLFIIYHLSFIIYYLVRIKSLPGVALALAFAWGLQLPALMPVIVLCIRDKTDTVANQTLEGRL